MVVEGFGSREVDFAVQVAASSQSVRDEFDASVMSPLVTGSTVRSWSSSGTQTGWTRERAKSAQEAVAGHDLPGLVGAGADVKGRPPIHRGQHLDCGDSAQPASGFGSG